MAVTYDARRGEFDGALPLHLFRHLL